MRLGFRRNFLLCISSLISSQGLSKVFWKFKIWHRCIPMHILAWTDCVKVQVSFDIRTRVYFRVSLHLTNDIKPWNKNQRKRIKRDRATGIIQKLLSYVNCREIYFSYTWQTNTLTNKMEMMLRDKQIPSPTRWKWCFDLRIQITPFVSSNFSWRSITMEINAIGLHERTLEGKIKWQNMYKPTLKSPLQKHQNTPMKLVVDQRRRHWTWCLRKKV